MLAKGQEAAALIEAHRPAAGPGPDRRQPATQDGIGLALADAGYLLRGQPDLPRPGPADRHRQAPRPGKSRPRPRPGRPRLRRPGHPGHARAARTPDGIAAYRQRGHIAETPHGHIKHNMGFRQLCVRGKRKASAEWEFVSAVHNLCKALSTGHLTSQALTALAR